MARIRSIHPGLRTDEQFMSLTFAARDALPAIWMQADDQGVFEWKPLTLKARIFPADNVDMLAILSELEENQWIKRVEIDGAVYGLCRNFRKWQRPKKPTAVHPLPNHFRTYVGLKPVGSPPVGNQEGTSGETSPQMEDGGGRMEEEGDIQPSADAKGASLKGKVFGPCVEFLTTTTGKPEADVRGLLGKWCSEYGDETAIQAVVEAQRNSPLSPIPYCEKVLRNSKRESPKPVDVGDPTENLWRARLANWKPGKYWNRDHWGPAPNEPGCKAPTALLTARSPPNERRSA